MSSQRHEPSTFVEPEERQKYKNATDSSNGQNPFENTWLFKQIYLKIHPKDPCHNPKDGHHKRRSSKQQLKLYQLIPHVILQANTIDSKAKNKDTKYMIKI